MLRRIAKLVIPLMSVFAMLLTCRMTFGQAITGDILGTVQDSSNAVVAGAKVTLTEVNTGLKFEATSGASGEYLFAQLKPGHYKVEVTKEGFETATVTNIELLVGQRPRVDITLRIGAVTQTIEVSAGGVQLLESQTSSVGQVDTSVSIVELPLNGRNFVQLMYTSAGVDPVYNGTSPSTSWTGQSNLTTSVAGLRESDESFLLDGIETRNARFGSVGLRPSIDAIQEFKMQTDAFSAEFGRSAAVVNTTIKSGANLVHGSVFEFLRNSDLDSNNFFLNRVNSPIPAFRQNDFGFSLGGPVVFPHLYHGQDKTFFFINYEGIRSRQGAENTGLVPSAAQMQGNLEDDSAGTGIFPTGSTFCNNNAGSPKCVPPVINPATGLAFTNNVIPTAMLDPIAQRWVPYVSKPNVAITPGLATPPVANVFDSPMTRNDMNQGNARMDHTLTSKDNMFGSFSFEDRPHTAPGLQFQQGNTYPLRNQLLAITETHVFSPSVVNEARFGYNRTKTFLQGLGAFTENYAANVFGWTNTSPNPFDFGLPDASITGFSGIGAQSESIGALDQDYQFVDNLSIVSGPHNVKMGVTLIHEKFYQITDFSGIPSFGFTGNYTGVGMADFLLGDAYTLRTAVGDSHQNLHSNYWGGYLQDNWRVKPSFTLNLGMRFEHAQTPQDTADRTGWFDNQVSQWITSESGGVRNGIFDPEWHNFAPRVGFAYSPKFLPNTVIRSAYGIFYATDNWNELQFEVIGPAYYSTATLTNTLPLPTYNLEHVFPSLAPSSNTSLTPFSVDKRSRTPYVQEWNFGIQHTFAKDWLLDVSYVGDEGLKLPVREDENYPKSDPTGTIPYASRVPFPGFGYILFDHDAGWSSYNALQVKVEHRFTNGLYFLGTYTWSHQLDYASTDESQSYSGINALSKGNGTYDERQRAVMSFTYELPMGHGKRFAAGSTGVVDHLISGWKVNGIPTFDTGTYTTPTLPQNWTNNGSYGINRPNKVGSEIPANRTYTDWLNIAAYVYPGCSTYVYATCNASPSALHISGNAARDSIRVPGVNDWDLALVKDTHITESKTVQFRAEAFNAFNHVQFSSPSTSINPATFGIISGLLIGARQVQFGLKLLW